MTWLKNILSAIFPGMGWKKPPKPQPTGKPLLYKDTEPFEYSETENFEL